MGQEGWFVQKGKKRLKIQEGKTQEKRGAFACWAKVPALGKNLRWIYHG
jgi:hypothetical protein